ncbi:hypothetical protein EMIT0P253_420015 [Pseudomonas sp. IT-P253]
MCPEMTARCVWFFVGTGEACDLFLLQSWPCASELAPAYQTLPATFEHLPTALTDMSQEGEALSLRGPVLSWRPYFIQWSLGDEGTHPMGWRSHVPR